MKLFTTTEVLEKLKRSLDGQTQKSVSVQLGFTPQYINDVVRGRRDISAELARALGYERKVYFERVK